MVVSQLWEAFGVRMCVRALVWWACVYASPIYHIYVPLPTQTWNHSHKKQE